MYPGTTIIIGESQSESGRGWGDIMMRVTYRT